MLIKYLNISISQNFFNKHKLYIKVQSSLLKRGNMDLEKFFKAKSVAIVGVSKDPRKVGHVIFRNLLDANFHGKLFLVNPNAYEILNREVYKSLTEIREEVELAVIAVPAKKVLDVIKDCGKRKIKNVVVISSGFKEIGNEKLELQLKDLVTKNTEYYVKQVIELAVISI